MLLRHASPARLELRTRGSWGAPLLSAALFFGFGLSVLLAPGPVTASRAAFAALLAAVAATLGVWARPRERSVRVALDAGVVEAGERSFPLTRVRAIALGSGGSTLEAAPFPRYRAELLLDDGSTLVVLDDGDPSRVLRDLRSMLAHWQVPVTSGWGLPLGAEPWRSQSKQSPVIASNVEERARPREGELGAGICVLGGALVVGTAMALMHGARISRGEPSSVLSYALSGSLLGFILLLGVFMVTDRVTARLSEHELRVERRALGIHWSRLTVPVERLGGVWAVGLVPGEPRHLVVDRDGELLTLAFYGEAAARFAAGWTAG